MGKGEEFTAEACRSPRGGEEALNFKHEIRKEENEPRMDAKWEEEEKLAQRRRGAEEDELKVIGGRGRRDFLIF
jgi:hypothetical protein